MRIVIHRGIDQIGGCITEISTAKSKVLIDLGHNLPQGDEPVEDKMDNPTTVEALCEGCDAIFYTHYHGDHETSSVMSPIRCRSISGRSPNG